MKLSLLFLLLASVFAPAGMVAFAWSANPEPDIVGYRLYHGTASGDYSEIVDVGNVTMTAMEVEPGLHFFTLTAINSLGFESLPASELTFDISAEVILDPLRVVEIQTSPDLVNWQPVAVVPLEGQAKQMFVRAVIKEVER